MAKWTLQQIRERNRIKAQRYRDRQRGDEPRQSVHLLRKGEVVLYDPKEYLPSGMGIKGAVIFHKPSDKVQCFECGGWLTAINHSHLSRADHGGGLTVAEYKVRHGLKKTTALISEGLRRRLVVAADPGTLPFRGYHDQSVSRRTLSAEEMNDRRTCPVQMLARLKEISEALGGRTPTADEMEAGHVHYCTLVARHGSVANAMILAGLTPRPASIPPGPRYTAPLLTAMLVNFQNTHGHTPTNSDFRRGLLPTRATFARAFGSWSAACESANMMPRKRGRPLMALPVEQHHIAEHA